MAERSLWDRLAPVVYTLTGLGAGLAVHYLAGSTDGFDVRERQAWDARRSANAGHADVYGVRSLAEPSKLDLATEARPTQSEREATPVAAVDDKTSAARIATQTEPTAGVDPRASAEVVVDPLTALRKAEQHNQRGFASAAKGAWFSARSEFATALRTVVEAADAARRSNRRSTSLGEALTALAEAADFVSRTPHSHEPIDLAALTAGHRTRVFDATRSAAATPAAAHEAYLEFAVHRLAEAASGDAAASVALHGLGKVHSAVAAQNPTAIPDGRGKAAAYFRAALEAGPDNFLAANDWAVLLAEEGRYEEARAVMEAALRVSPQPAMWNNLAAIHGRMGDRRLAEQCRLEAVALERRAAKGSTPAPVLPTYNVTWLPPRQFAATMQPESELRRAPTTPAAGDDARSQAAERPVLPTAARPRPGSFLN